MTIPKDRYVVTSSLSACTDVAVLFLCTVKEVCLQNNVISLCLSQLEEPNPLLQQWLALCLGKLWRKYDPARWCGVRDSAHEKLQSLLWHDIPDVSKVAYLGYSNKCAFFFWCACTCVGSSCSCVCSGYLHPQYCRRWESNRSGHQYRPHHRTAAIAPAD